MNDVSYGDFAYIYDYLTDDVEYAKRAEYVEKLIRRHGIENSELLCDLGCGTGSICEILSRRGFDVIGVDNSDAMLSVAAEKNNDGKILYLNQDMTEFELFGTVDVFTCLLDSINYITNEELLKNMFALVNNYLNPEGIFIFDINSRYKFEEILADNTYVYEKDKIFYTWENYYEDEILDFYLNFFVKDGKTYRRMSEHHVQKYYSVDKIRELCEQNSLQICGIYDDLTFNSITDDSERIFFVVKKLQLQ